MARPKGEIATAVDEGSLLRITDALFQELEGQPATELLFDRTWPRLDPNAWDKDIDIKGCERQTTQRIAELALAATDVLTDEDVTALELTLQSLVDNERLSLPDSQLASQLLGLKAPSEITVMEEYSQLAPIS